MPTVNVAQDSEPELQEIADILGKSRKVVVVTGAGISTNCGIPDFRSENGLYSLIQAQYEAAVQNPPWEDTNSFENERPFKRRRASDRWYYEIVPNPVSEIDRNSSAQGRPRRSLRSRLSAEVTSGEITSSPSSLSDSSIIPLSSSHSFRSQPPTEDTPVDTTTTVSRPSHNGICKLHQPAPDSVAAAPSTITNISALENDPPCRRRSLRSQSVTASTPKSSTSTTSASTPSCSSVADVLPLTRRITLQREASSCLTTQSDNDEPSSTQSSLSTSTRASLPNLKGRDLFDSMIWSDPLTTSIFYMFISSLRQKIEKDVTSTTETHKFIKALRDGGRLVRNYTQNIDALEAREGLCTELGRGPGNKARFQPKLQREPRPSEIREGEAHDAGVEVVMLHGSLVSLRCGLCAKLSSWDEGDRQTVTLAGKAPDCPSCAEYNAKREGKGRRSLAVGRLRPDIVLYGEEHPNAHLVAPLVTHDLALGPDVLLILGTSLRVHGLKVMVKEFAKAVHVRGGKVIFVNQTKPPESIWGDVIDYWVEWDCDEWVLDLKQRRGEIWLPQGSLEEQNKREAPLAEPKSESKKPYRPQALRDDKLNAVHFTFKILDTLRNIEDSYGQATRRIYFDKPPRKSNASILDSKLLVGVKAESLQAPTAPPKAAPKSKRGRSLPGCLRDEKRNGAYLITAMDRNCKLGEYMPGLRALPLKSRRDPLTETPANGVSTAPASFTYNSGKYDFPILAGLVQAIQPVAHNNSTLPRDFNNKGFRSYLHQPSSPCKLPPLLSPDTIIVDNRRASFPLLQPSQISSDTIVVEPPRPTQEQDQRDTFPTPPVSDPTTPSKRRIKSLGSIGAILSSPLDSAEKATELLHVYNDSE